MKFIFHVKSNMKVVTTMIPLHPPPTPVKQIKDIINTGKQSRIPISGTTHFLNVLQTKGL